MHLGLFDKIKQVGGFINKAEEGIETFQMLLRGAKAIQSADLYHQGHPTLKTIEDQVNELETILINSFQELFNLLKNRGNLIKQKGLAIKKEVEDLTAFVKAQAKGAK